MALVAGQEPYQGQIEKMLRDRDVNVRLAAIASAMISPGETTSEALKNAFDDSAPEVHFAAAKALFTLNDPAGKPALLAVLAGESKTSSGFIAQQRRGWRQGAK